MFLDQSLACLLFRLFVFFFFKLLSFTVQWLSVCNRDFLVSGFPMGVLGECGFQFVNDIVNYAFIASDVMCDDLTGSFTFKSS